MKRTFLAVIAILSLAAGFAEIQSVLPLSIQRYFDDRADQERMMKTNDPAIIRSLFPSQFAPSRMINGIEMVDAFIDIADKGVIKTLQANGVIINCEFNDFVTAQIPVDRLTTVSRLNGVIDVEISKVLEFCTDSTLNVTHAGQVINGEEYGLPQGYDGSGVVIGIIDAGFDYQHIAFRTADSTRSRRIVRVYDPEDSTGHPVIIGTYQLPGSVFMDEQLDSIQTDTIGNTHGTHTAGIAAGTHVNGYGGMAPGADIVLCSSRLLNLGVSEIEVVNCIKYIYSYADSVGKPCVISVSVSTLQGPHDGQDRISKALAQNTGPGHIFVIAAGNTGNSNYYTSGMAYVDKPINMLVGQIPSNLNSDGTFYYKNAWFDTWVRDKSVRPLAQFHILNKETGHIVWRSSIVSLYKQFNVSEFSDYFQPDLSFDSIGYMSALISQNSNFKYELQCYFHNLRSKEYTIAPYTGQFQGKYAIGVTIYPPKPMYPRQPDTCFVDSWMVIGSRLSYNNTVYVDEVDENGDTITRAIDNFYCKANNDCSIGTYAVGDSTISAGGYVGRNSFYTLFTDHIYVDNTLTVGAAYPISSYQLEGCGPTGKVFPTVTAPSTYVISAGSRFSYMNDYTNGSRSMVVEGCPWGAMSGTSMAAPTVAGIIAQWLQINPQLSPSDVKDIISRTSIKDQFTENPAYSFRFGPNGKIDAMAGVRYLLGLDDNPEPQPMLGDVNDDGTINVTDASRLIAYLLSINDETSTSDDIEINMENSDLDGSGDITITDLIALINYLISATDVNPNQPAE